MTEYIIKKALKKLTITNNKATVFIILNVTVIMHNTFENVIPN